MVYGSINSWQIEGEKGENSERFYFLWLKNHWGVIKAMKFKDACFLKESYDKPRQHIQKQRHTFSTKVHLVKTMVFLLVMYGYESCSIKKVSTKELMLSYCGAGEDSWESIGLQGDQKSQF